MPFPPSPSGLKTPPETHNHRTDLQTDYKKKAIFSNGLSYAILFNQFSGHMYLITNIAFSDFILSACFMSLSGNL